MKESIGVLLIVTIAYFSFHALFEILVLALDAFDLVDKILEDK